MALTNEEAAQLAVIARSVAASDPRLARALTGSAPRRRRGRTLGALLVVVLAFVVLMTLGLTLGIPAVCGAAWASVLVGLLLVGIAGASPA